MGIFEGIAGLLKEGAKLADDFITTEEEKFEQMLKKEQLNLEKEKLKLEEKKLDNQIIELIHKTNIAEAKSKNLFIAGWRPFIGWVSGFAIAYFYILSPFLHSLFKAFNIEFPLPQLDIGVLFNLLIAMLGMAGLRTFEKVKGVSHKHD